MFGTLSLVVWMSVWSRSTSNTSFLSFKSRSVSARPSFFARDEETFNSGTEWIIGTEALDDDATSICWRSAPQSAHKSLIMVVWRHSVSSTSGELQIWLESQGMLIIFTSTYLFATIVPSLCRSFVTSPQFVFFKRSTLSFPGGDWNKHKIDPFEIWEPLWTIHLRILISLSGDRICLASLMLVSSLNDELSFCYVVLGVTEVRITVEVHRKWLSIWVM